MNDFNYLPDYDIYLDSACQSVRPQPVIDTLDDYYHTHNSCGERVKYQWGKITDQKVEATREHVIKFLKLKKRDYFTSFTLNTTYGLNLLLNQFNPEAAGIKHIVTSEIEHNSTYLSTMAFAQKHQIDRIILGRQPDGSITPDDIPSNSLVVVNCVSNVDGRRLENIKDIIKYVHKTGGFIIIDAAQAIGHNSALLHKTTPDAICFSAHKMYAPSLGVMVVRRDLIKNLNITFIGGGMVDDVERESYLLSSDNPDHVHTIFEPGLQAWGEIIALDSAINWLEALPESAHRTLSENCAKLYIFLKDHPKITVLGSESASTMSFYVDGLDSHLLGAALAEDGIMARTGYFCVHYYLDHVKNYPPLVRFSLGYHNTSDQVNRVIAALENI